jgi:hypothetical protein
MRTIITFFAVIATLNATARVGSAYWNHYQLEDTVRSIITFGGVTPPETIQRQVMDKAERLDVVLDYEEVTVTREGQTTTVDASYTKPIEVFPRFVRDFRFRVHESSVYTGTVPFGQR